MFLSSGGWWWSGRLSLYEARIQENSVPSSQFSCQSKASLKNKVYQKSPAKAPQTELQLILPPEGLEAGGLLRDALFLWRPSLVSPHLPLDLQMTSLYSYGSVLTSGKDHVVLIFANTDRLAPVWLHCCTGSSFLRGLLSQALSFSAQNQGTLLLKAQSQIRCLAGAPGKRGP